MTTAKNIAALTDTVYRPIAKNMPDDALRTAFSGCHQPLRAEDGELRVATDAEIAMCRAVIDEFRTRFVL